MEEVAHKTNGVEPNPDRIIWIMPWPGLAARLARAAAEPFVSLAAVRFDIFERLFCQITLKLVPSPVRELSSEDRWPTRLKPSRAAFAIDPIEPGADAASCRYLRPLSSFIGLRLYVAYLAFFSQFAHLRVVNRAYKKFDPDKLLAKLYYPPQMLRATT